MNIEYQCDYEKLASNLYKVWLKSNSSIEVSGTSILDCEIKLELIFRKGKLNDLITFKYEKPFPKSTLPANVNSWEYIVLTPLEIGHVRNNLSEMYSKGLCQRCNRPLGSRSEQKIEIEKGAGNPDILFIRKLPAIVVSDNCLERLDLSSYFAIKEVLVTRKSSVKYYEILPNPELCLESIALRDNSDFYGKKYFYKCSECNYKRIQYLTGTHFSEIIKIGRAHV